MTVKVGRKLRSKEAADKAPYMTRRTEMKSKQKAKKGGFAKKAVGLLGLVYAGVFAVFYFDLDGKLLYYVVEPFLKNHYDRMQRRDPHSVPYGQIDDEYM